MISANEDISQFLSDWVEEFTRAVEMFSGTRPTVRHETVDRPEQSSEQLAGYLWWKQVFEGAGSFTTWIGAAEATYSALGGVQDDDTADAKSMYLEMIGQAQQGAATVLSLGLPKPFKCLEGSTGSAPVFDNLVVASIAVTFGDQVLEPLVVAISGEFIQLMSPSSTPQSVPLQPPPSQTGPVAAPMLNRLLELELPLSVALGRAVMPIREVLKVTSGSLIELDRNVGDYVDLVVHGKIVARGEVVSVKGNYGVRVKEIISRDDRLTLYGVS